MKNTITEDAFMREVEQWDTRREQFSSNGWRAIFRYIGQVDEDTGTDTELDIVAICCEFAEHESAIEAVREYQPDDMRDEKAAREWLEERTTVLDVEGGGVVIVQF